MLDAVQYFCFLGGGDFLGGSHLPSGGDWVFAGVSSGKVEETEALATKEASKQGVI